MTTKEQRAALRAALQDARNVKCVVQVVGQTVAIDLLELVDEADRAAGAEEQLARIRYAIDMLDDAAHDSISMGAAVEWFDDCEPCTCGLRGCDRKPCKGQCGCVACSQAWAEFLSME